MRLTSTTMLHGVTCVSIVFMGTACQTDGADSIDLPTEEPTSVTDNTSDPETSAITPSTPRPDESAATPPTTDHDDGPSIATPSSRVPIRTTDLFATTEPARSPTQPTVATETVYDVGTIDAGLLPFVKNASADLAQRLAVDTDAIEVLTAVLVRWPDSALGCPEPGMAYAQVTTDGSVIELAVDGLVYRYHSGGSRSPFLCERPLDPVPTPE